METLRAGQPPPPNDTTGIMAGLFVFISFIAVQFTTRFLLQVRQTDRQQLFIVTSNNTQTGIFLKVEITYE